MKSSTFNLLMLALGAALLLFGVNYLANFKSIAVNDELASFGNLGLNPAEVRGMSVEKAGKTFTLNKEQQAKALSFINTMVPVDKKDYTKKEDFDFTRIVVYRFNGPNVSLVPIARADSDIVFDVPMLNSDSYFLAKSGDELNSLIQKATED